MTTARIRNYVRKNPERVEAWKNKVLKKHLIRELSRIHSKEDLSNVQFNTQRLTGHGGQNKICNDILEDHYELAYESASDNAGRYARTIMYVYQDKFLEMIEGIDEVPDFMTTDLAKKYEDDIYTSLNKISLPCLAYIYHNQDKFCFIDKTVRGYSSRRYSDGLGVFYKHLKDEADNLAFRNALADYYGDKLNAVGEIVFDKHLPMLVEQETSNDENAYNGGYYSYAHNNVLPREFGDVNISQVDILAKNAAKVAEKFAQTADQLRVLHDSMVEAGGDEAFIDLYYEKMIANFYRNLPLFINVKDADLKEMALRASKRKFT